jgi:hypothetical protein
MIKKFVISHDYLMFSIGLIIGGLVIGIYGIFRYDEKFKRSLNTFKKVCNRRINNHG